MKKIILSICILVVVNLLPSCSKDDTTNEHPEILGSWKRNVNWGSIDGTETITFLNNSTYSVELERIEAFSGPCTLDPYCDSDYSGKYWFEEDALYYNESTIGWTDNWATWSVQGNLLHLDNDIYQKQ